MWNSVDKKFSTPPPTWRKQRPPPSPMSERKTTMPLSANNNADLFHVIHKVPAGDSPYVRAKHIQLIDKDPAKAISMFWAAINAGDRVDSALKDMAVVMKQLDRSDEAIEAIRSFRHLCPHESQESLDNVLIELYKRSGRIQEEIELLKLKLQNIEEGTVFGGARTKMARSQGKKIQITIEQERSRILGNLAWAYMQQNDYETAEPYYRQALSLETDKNKQCNLAICLMHMNKMTEAKFLLQAVRASAGNKLMDSSYAKSYERAAQMLTELEPSTLKEDRGSIIGYGRQRAYASPVILTQPRRPSVGSDDREQRRERWGNYGPGSSNKLSSERSLHSETVPFTQPRRPFTCGFNFRGQTRGNWEEEKAVGSFVRKLSFDHTVTARNVQAAHDALENVKEVQVATTDKSKIRMQKPEAALPSLTSEEWNRRSWRDNVEMKDEVVVVMQSSSESIANRDQRSSTCWGNHGGFVEEESGAFVDGKWTRDTEKYVNDRRKSALKESNSTAALPTGGQTKDNNAIVLKTAIGDETTSEKVNSSHDYCSTAKDKKSWADIVEEEEKEKELSSSKREGLEEFNDENLNSNIIYPSPQNQADYLSQKFEDSFDLNDGYDTSRSAGVLSRNPTVRRSLCFDQQQRPDSTDSLLPMKDKDYLKNVNVKRRNRLQVFQDITPFPDSP